jgi:tetratricopeptide (TPR) repeat protein
MQAREYYSAAIDQSPFYAAAHNNLAQVMFELGDARLAQTHAEQAVSLGGQFLESYKKTLATINNALLATPSN